MSERDEDLTAEERSALTALRRDLEPPAALEHKVVVDLRSRGLLRERSATWRRRLRPVAAVGAAAALVLAGVWVGSQSKSRPAFERESGQPRYVLFLEGPGEPSPDEEARRVEEYKLWARRIAGAGHLISGEKLRPEAIQLGGESAGAAGGESVRGFFVIAAKDDREALETRAAARTCATAAGSSCGRSRPFRDSLATGPRRAARSL